jgi:hypothetical protein
MKDQQDTSKWVIDQSECPDPPPVNEFDEPPEELEENVIKKEITAFPTPKSHHTKKRKDEYRHPAAPPSEFRMEDDAIKRTTLQEIQNFFGISEPSDSSPNPTGILENKYSSSMMHSRSDEALTNSNSQSEAAPKDANEAVRVFPLSFFYQRFDLFATLYLRCPFGSLEKIICSLRVVAYR